MQRAYEFARRPISLIILLVIGLGLLSWNSYQILNKPLWGYHPMGWMLGGYFLVLCCFWKKLTKTPGAFKRILLSTLSGILLSLSFPMSPLTFLIFIALVPLLVVATEKELSFWGLVGHAFHAFVLWNIITTFWVLNTSFAPGIVANTLNAFFMTTPWMLFYLVRKHFPVLQSYIGLAAFYMSFEYLHLQWEISWPWLTMGNIFSTFPDWVQWYEFTGVFGGSLWIWIINLMVFWVVMGWRKNPKSWIFIGIGIVLPVIISYVTLWNRTDRGPEIEVVIVQPNYEPHYEKFKIPQRQQLAKMKDLAEEGITENTDYVLFPETVINRVLLNRVNSHSGIKMFKELSVQNPGLNVISGISSFRTYPLDSLGNKSTRTHISSRGDTTYWDLQNAAIWIADDEIKMDYFKSKLVPGAEIFPYSDYLPFLTPIVDQLGGSKEGHFIQDHREVFGEDEKQIAPVICYESIYGEYVADYIQKGAKAIFIMTNDGWWDVTPGHRQHLAFSRLRAIEMRRSIARAANTGVSCYINQLGKVSKPTRYGEDAVIRSSIRCNDQLTAYARLGDYIAHIAILTTGIMVLLLIIRILLRK